MSVLLVITNIFELLIPLQEHVIAMMNILMMELMLYVSLAILLGNWF